jgi:hypothetical protein
MNALTDEKKSHQLRTGLDGWCDKVRVAPTVVDLLDRFRPDSQGKGTQLVLGALKFALIERIVRDEFAACHDALGALLGRGATAGPAVRKPGAKVSQTPQMGQGVPQEDVGKKGVATA